MMEKNNSPFTTHNSQFNKVGYERVQGFEDPELARSVDISLTNNTKYTPIILRKIRHIAGIKDEK